MQPLIEESLLQSLSLSKLSPGVLSTPFLTLRHIPEKGRPQSIWSNCLVFFKKTYLPYHLHFRWSADIQLHWQNCGHTLFCSTDQPTIVLVNNFSVGFLNYLAHARLQWTSILNQSVKVVAIADSRSLFHFPIRHGLPWSSDKTFVLLYSCSLQLYEFLLVLRLSQLFYKI